MSETVAARWEEYNEAGRRSVGLGQVAEAEELFRAAVREGEQLGADSPHLATSLNALGQLRLQAKDLAEAESCFSRALAIRQRTYGPDSHAIVPSLNNLSALHDAKGETDKAVDLLKRSLDISEKALGNAHPEVTLALSNLAKLYFKRRDFSKADRILLRLLETKRALGKDHPEVATVLGSLAKLRQAVGKHGPAEQLWRQSLAIRERAFAPNDPILATTIENVSDCCAAQEGKLGDAIALRERAIAIREVAMGSGHPSLATARAKLEELRARPGAAAATAASAPPPRTSQEIPSPLLSAEVPPFPAVPPRAPSPDLPWIQVDGDPTGERPAARLELMGIEPPSAAGPRAPDRAAPPAAPAARRPLAPPPIPAALRPVGNDLVFTDSLAPEATPPQPRHPDRAMRPAAPPRRRTPPRANAVAPRAAVRMPPTMTAPRGRSRKGLVAFVLVIVAGAAAWFAFIRDAGAPGTLLAAPLFSAESKPVAASPAVTRSPAVTPPISNAGAPREDAVAAPPARSSAVADSAEPTTVAKEKRRVVRDSTTPLEADLAAPTIPSSVEVDAVTRGIEQSTKAKVDSAQKTRIDVKPIFKKP